MEPVNAIDRLEDWLEDGPAALVLREWLVPAEGDDATIYPPTFAPPRDQRRENWTPYCIDTLSDGTKVCLLDTVGSQGNRLEPVFKREPYAALVPKITINIGERELDLLDAGHRAADALVRLSPPLNQHVERAFRAWQDHGDARPLAKIAPTSLVFGAWDSRGSGAKIPRLLRSEIRAYDIESMSRDAQYVPPLDYVRAGIISEEESRSEKIGSELGLAHVPAGRGPGGIRVRGEIRRDASVNLTALRTLGAGDGDATALRHYVLGLALVALTAPGAHDLRQGCLLVRHPERPSEWTVVGHDGVREAVSLPHEGVRRFAERAAEAFEVGEPRTAFFDAKAARDAVEEVKKGRSKKGGS